ncbi:D-2-hydroxyacid dehydrogenase [Parashewanella spongiae]|uniref:D-2-hydroxyacid dehydrogenase n=1 Tax=Parashewanella spongiae TaxID=342950 RepID=A0A3A6TVW6_9GAMM|nr:D-2-hydroxyacid dehydrogenase [Parashewanella spongiae]MCL1076668.1 D-2-hydroxyacid dehydrogenase [Parashewanella spongiae]RJY18477.1 D-2-hydroxyacid dehydrogenase [Parashewanella spongiae]
MNITVLDYHTLNSGDIDDSELLNLANVTCYPRTAEKDIVDRAFESEIILTNKTPLSATTLANLPNLKLISVLATGTNVVDIAAANKLGITVCNVPAYSTESVAQMVFAHILNHYQRVAQHHRAVAKGDWQNCNDFCFRHGSLQSLKNKTIGIIGFGETGKQAAQIAAAFGMKVIVHSRTQPEVLPPNTTLSDLSSLFQQSDIVSLHCPLTPHTEQLVNHKTLSLMKTDALLINCARGGLINEQDLADKLKTGTLFAGVDVLSTEPPATDNPLLSAPNISITPHIAWATLEARQALIKVTVANIKSYLAGELQNLVHA